MGCSLPDTIYADDTRHRVKVSTVACAIGIAIPSALLAIFGVLAFRSDEGTPFPCRVYDAGFDYEGECTLVVSWDVRVQSKFGVGTVVEHYSNCEGGRRRGGGSGAPRQRSSSSFPDPDAIIARHPIGSNGTCWRAPEYEDFDALSWDSHFQEERWMVCFIVAAITSIVWPLCAVYVGCVRCEDKYIVCDSCRESKPQQRRWGSEVV